MEKKLIQIPDEDSNQSDSNDPLVLQEPLEIGPLEPLKPLP